MTSGSSSPPDGPFPQQVHLEPSDISEVTSKRVLSKSAAARQRSARSSTSTEARLPCHTS